MSEAIPEVIHVVAAVIEKCGRFLIARRPAGKRHAGKWEFPGGKMEPGETESEALSRELAEELGVETAATGASEISVVDRGSNFEIHFIPTTIRGTPEPREHSALTWVTLNELITYDLADSDRCFVQYRISKGSLPLIDT